MLPLVETVLAALLLVALVLFVLRRRTGLLMVRGILGLSSLGVLALMTWGGREFPSLKLVLYTVLSLWAFGYTLWSRPLKDAFSRT